MSYISFTFTSIPLYIGPKCRRNALNINKRHEPTPIEYLSHEKFDMKYIIDGTENKKVHKDREEKRKRKTDLEKEDRQEI